MPRCARRHVGSAHLRRRFRIEGGRGCGAQSVRVGASPAHRIPRHAAAKLYAAGGATMSRIDEKSAATTGQTGCSVRRLFEEHSVYARYRVWTPEVRALNYRIAQEAAQRDRARRLAEAELRRRERRDAYFAAGAKRQVERQELMRPKLLSFAVVKALVRGGAGEFVGLPAEYVREVLDHPHEYPQLHGDVVRRIMRSEGATSCEVYA
jgi:hypothetical protein